MSEPVLRPLGILGGTFDPVHLGHLRLAEEACDQLGLTAVRWIPAGQPTHRAAPSSTAQHRLNMVHSAISSNPRFQLDDTEVLNDAPSYTVPTLQRLRTELGTEQPLVLLLGTDAFAGLDTWHRWHELFDLAHIAVATRPGTPFNPFNPTHPTHPAHPAHASPQLAAEFSARQVSTPLDLQTRPAGHILSFPITALDISATQLRAQFAAGRSTRYLLPTQVLDYIFSHHLYSS